MSSDVAAGEESEDEQFFPVPSHDPLVDSASSDDDSDGDCGPELVDESQRASVLAARAKTEPLGESELLAYILEWNGRLPTGSHPSNPGVDCSEIASSVDNLCIFQQSRYRQIAGLTSFKSLRKLEILCQSIYSIKNLDSLSHLTLLNLNDNRISSFEGLDKLHSLERLYLDHNDFVELNLNQLSNNSKLRLLSICDNSIQSIELSDDGHILPVLSVLRIGGNKLNSIPESMNQLRLIELNVSGNHISNLIETIRPFLVMSTLRLLSFSSNRFGSNPLCKLYHYQSFIIYRLPHLLALDGQQISDSIRQSAITIWKKKDLFYSSRMKSSKRIVMQLIDDMNRLIDCLIRLINQHRQQWWINDQVYQQATRDKDILAALDQSTNQSINQLINQLHKYIEQSYLDCSQHLLRLQQMVSRSTLVLNKRQESINSQLSRELFTAGNERIEECSIDDDDPIVCYVNQSIDQSIDQQDSSPRSNTPDRSINQSINQSVDQLGYRVRRVVRMNHRENSVRFDDLFDNERFRRQREPVNYKDPSVYQPTYQNPHIQQLFLIQQPQSCSHFNTHLNDHAVDSFTDSSSAVPCQNAWCLAATLDRDDVKPEPYVFTTSVIEAINQIAAINQSNNQSNNQSINASQVQILVCNVLITGESKVVSASSLNETISGQPPQRPRSNTVVVNHPIDSDDTSDEDDDEPDEQTKEAARCQFADAGWSERVVFIYDRALVCPVMVLDISLDIQTPSSQLYRSDQYPLFESAFDQPILDLLQQFEINQSTQFPSLYDTFIDSCSCIDIIREWAVDRTTNQFLIQQQIALMIPELGQSWPSLARLLHQPTTTMTTSSHVAHQIEYLNLVEPVDFMIADHTSSPSILDVHDVYSISHSLKWLSLSGCRLASLSFVNRLPLLAELDVSYCGLTKESFRSLNHKPDSESESVSLVKDHASFRTFRARGNVWLIDDKPSLIEVLRRHSELTELDLSIDTSAHPKQLPNQHKKAASFLSFAYVNAASSAFSQLEWLDGVRVDQSNQSIKQLITRSTVDVVSCTKCLMYSPPCQNDDASIGINEPLIECNLDLIKQHAFGLRANQSLNQMSFDQDRVSLADSNNREWPTMTTAIELDGLRLQSLSLNTSKEPNIESESASTSPWLTLRRLSAMNNQLSSADGITEHTISSLTELSLDMNRLTHFDNHIKQTSISSNPSESLKYLHPVSLRLMFPRILRLDLSSNLITSLTQLVGLSTLTSLSIECNRLVDLRSINQFPYLVDCHVAHNLIDCLMDSLIDLKDAYALMVLDLIGNPCMKVSTCRSMIIHLSPALRVLNNQSINQSERDAAFESHAGRLDDQTINQTVGHQFLGHVEHLDLSGSQLRSVQSIDQAVLPNLLSLVLDNNSVQTVADFCPLPRLRSLRLNGNQLTELPTVGQILRERAHHPASHEHAKLHLADPHMSYFAWCYPQLQSLELGYNRIAQFEQLCFNGLSQLNVLVLEGNEIGVIRGNQSLYQSTTPSVNQSIGQACPRLEHLLLARNRIRSVDPTALYGLDYLKSLQLEENQLTYLSINQIMPNLIHLYLSNNRINEWSDLEGVHGNQLPSLESMTLVGCPISRKHLIRVNAINRMPSLKMFDQREITEDERDRAQAINQQINSATEGENETNNGQSYFTPGQTINQTNNQWQSVEQPNHTSGSFLNATQICRPSANNMFKPAPPISFQSSPHLFGTSLPAPSPHSSPLSLSGSSFSSVSWFQAVRNVTSKPMGTGTFAALTSALPNDVSPSKRSGMTSSMPTLNPVRNTNVRR